MSVILSDPYRGYAIHYPSPDKPDDYDLIAFGSPQSQLRTKLMTGRPCPSENTRPSFGTHPSVLPRPVSRPNSHNEPQLAYVSVNQMLPHQLSHYGYEISSLQETGKRARSEDEDDIGRDIDRNIGMHQSLPPLSIDGSSISAAESREILYSVHGDYSASHPSSSHEFPSPISLPIPQHHHHHRLPPQALLHTGHGLGSNSPPMSGVPPSVVGQPGMPEPAPRPRGPKLKFTPEEDALLVDLKEDKNLTWKQIADFFPGRTSGTLQVRYCTKLKAKDVVWTDEMSAFVSANQKLRVGLYVDAPQLPLQANHRPVRAGSTSNLTQLTQTLPITKLPSTQFTSYTWTMFLQRTAATLARRSPARAFTLAQRPFSSSIVRSNEKKWAPKDEGKSLSFDEIKSEDDLIPPGAKPGTIPTDYVQATGLERLELIGKMQGIDIFDMRPLDASRKGTLENPIIVSGAGDEQYAGCTGYPVDSHQVNWLTVSRERPIERCNECGNVVKLNYVGPEEDPHSHDHGHGHHPPHEEPKTFADYVKPDYWYR
ncbi:hypothetical protein N7476_008322 [Penicillium atrosanguineum]|uniref:Cytochrome c oxidase subunit 4, mitochondrial n=1 Tax=Penicillium atrosanguineum TaxID=1132637 RepID=A0A9W9PRJ0_9EURO|nr:hypothetical protein N7476_008322 [Penicillium atrosanguineum]